jgi:predicted SAM-dependent methyltransferase
VNAVLRLYLKRVGLDHLKKFALYCIRKLTVSDKKIIARYLSAPGDKKLHLGCGRNCIDGWLNTDLEPSRPTVASLNATARYPLPDAAFDYVFSEHMIEHIVYSDAQIMLRECYRVLKPGGRIRISTPNLQFLLDLFKPQKSQLQKDYIRWAAEAGHSPANEAHIFNRFVRAWGHFFIYDEKTLRETLEEAGFQNIEFCALNDSRFPALCNLENENRMLPGFLRLESMTIEAIKKPQ